MQHIVNRPSYNKDPDTKENLIFRTMKSLQYIVRFVCRSRILFTDLYPALDPTDDFEKSIRELLKSIVSMMCVTTDSFLREQGACLKYLPSTIQDILYVFDAKELRYLFLLLIIIFTNLGCYSYVLCDLLKNMPPGRLTKQKMMTINDIVHSKLFVYPDCRRILLPVFTRQVKALLEKGEEVSELLFYKRYIRTIVLLNHQKYVVNNKKNITQHAGIIKKKTRRKEQLC